MKKTDRNIKFSLRKLAVGLASVGIGYFAAGATGAYAADNENNNAVVESASTTENLEQSTPAVEEKTTTENKEEAGEVAAVATGTPAKEEATENVAGEKASATAKAAETPTATNEKTTDRAAQDGSKETTTEEKNLDNKTPQAADKQNVEASATLEKDKNYYEAKDFDGNKVIELTNVSTTTNQNIDLTSDLDKIKALDSATIYIEFKPKEGQSGTYSLFSASSATNNRSYYAVGVMNGSTPFVGAPNQGSQLYGGELKSGAINPTTWNSIAVSINRTSADGAGRIDVYFNGKSAFFSSKAGKFLKDFTDLTNMQLGRMNNGGNNIWGGNVDFRNFTIYNKALSADEVAKRSQILSREVAAQDSVDENGRLLTARDEVFVRKQLPRGTFRIPALVKMQDGTLVAGADQRNTGQMDYGDIEMVVRTSNDNGKTWGEKVTIFNPQNNPALGNYSASNPTTIDIALATDNNGKLYAMYDLFPEGQGRGTLPKQAVAAYKEINGVRYQIITKGGEEYTIRENGKVFDAAGKETNYSVVVDAKDKDNAYQDYGDVYEGSKKIGNILFKEGNNSFQAVYTSYLMVSESSDNGKTWSAPKNISNMVRTDDMIFQGTGPGAGITMKHGDHAGRIIFPTYATGRGNGNEHASLVYSDDEGKTWHTSDMIWPTRTNSETTIVELQNGALKAFMRTGGKVEEATSLDGGVTWINQKTTDRDSIRTQISAITTIQDGKEYILLSTPGASRRVDGFISIGEVQADNSIKWIKQRQIETGIYAYSSIVDLGNGEFGVLYEHGGRDAGYPEDLYYRKLNWKFLTEDSEVSTVEVAQSALTNQSDVIALTYNEGVVASENLVLNLSNGNKLEFLGQRDSTTLLFKWNKDTDQGVEVTGVASGTLDSLFGNKLDTTASLPYTLEPKETTKKLDFDTYYKGDENLNYGTTREEAGTAGQRVTTITYTLDSDGKVHEKVVTNTTNPVAKAIILGTKPTTSTQSTNLATRYEADEDFAYGERNEVAGSPKVETTTTTYEVDATTGKITPTSTTVTTNPGRAKVVYVGTKPTTKTSSIPSPVRYVANDEKDFGSANESVAGVEGVSTVTTTYTVDANTGEVTSKDSEAVTTKQPTATIVYVGTKPTVATKDLDYTTEYEADSTLALNDKKVKTPGVKGSEVTTTTYKLDGDHAVIDKTTTNTTNPKAEVVLVGTKPTVVTKQIAFGTDYVADATLNFEEKQETPGANGEETTTTTYKLENGRAVVDKVTEQQTTAPINKVVKVGTKPIVSTKEVAFETNYVADNTLDYGKTTVRTPGVKGLDTTTTTYKLVGNHAEKDKETTARTAEPTNEVIAVGTRPTVVTKQIAFGTDYVADATLNFEEKQETPGVNGEETTTTTYKVENGRAVEDATTTETTKKVVNKVVRVGNVKVEKATINPTTTYEADNTLAYNTTKVENEGVAGETTTTTTYKVDANGNLVEPVATTTTKNAVNKVVKVGNVNTSTSPIAIETVYEDDNENFTTSQIVVVEGSAGEATTMVTYVVDPATGALQNPTTTTTTTKEMVKRVIKRGTKAVVAASEDAKPTVEETVATSTVDIPFTTSYAADSSLEYGQTVVRVRGVVGKKVTTTNKATLNGEVVAENEVVVENTPATNEVIAIGTKSTTTTKEVAFGTNYVADSNLDYGTRTVRTPGVKGIDTTTTTYKLVGDKAVVDTITTTHTTQSTAEVIAVGTKSTTTTKDVAFGTDYVADPTLNFGETKEEVAGKVGTTQLTTTYKLEGDHAVIDSTSEKEVAAPVNKVVRVGNVEKTAQPIPFETTTRVDGNLEVGKTEEIAGEEGSKEVTTTYEVNPQSGKLENPKVAEKELKAPVNKVVKVGTKVGEKEAADVNTLVDEVKKQIEESNLSAEEKAAQLEIISKTSPKDKLVANVGGKEISVVLDNSKLGAERLVVVESEKANEVKDIVAKELPSSAVVDTYDIHLVDQDNNTISRSGETRVVTVAVTKDEDETIEVYYVNGATLEKIPSIYKDGQLTFFTNHFSTYTIVKSKPSRPDNNGDNNNGNNNGGDNNSHNGGGKDNKENNFPGNNGNEKNSKVEDRSTSVQKNTLPNTTAETTNSANTAATGAGLVALVAAAIAARRKDNK